MGKCGSLSLNSSRVRVGWLLSLLACRSLSRDRLQLCLVNGNSTQPSVELSGKYKCVSGKSFSSTLLTFGYFRSLLQVGERFSGSWDSWVFMLGIHILEVPFGSGSPAVSRETPFSVYMFWLFSWLLTPPASQLVSPGAHLGRRHWD